MSGTVRNVSSSGLLAEVASDTERASAADSARQRVISWSHALLSVAVILFITATAYGYYKLQQESDLAQYESQAALWLVVSFEREYLKFDSLMTRYNTSGGSRYGDELLIQYDVLWSRIDLMTAEGEHALQLRQVESYHQVVPLAARFVRQYEAEVFATIPEKTPLSTEFVEDYRAMNDGIHRFMVDVHINRSWSAEAREARIKDNRVAIYLTLGGTLVSTLMLFAIILVQLRDRHRNLMRTAEALAQSEKDRDALSREIYRRREVEKERKKLLHDLEARNEELERYAYTISHDLKSPLYTIQGFTGFLEQDLRQGRSDKMLEDLSKVKAAVQTMGRLLDDILSLSKVNLEQESTQPVELGEVVNQAINMVSREINEHGVMVSVDPNLPTVYGDSQRLTEVFQNLVSNAAKFMGGQKHPSVEIGARVEQQWAHCYVRDNGIGIDLEYQERVFNLFERLEPSTRGTGIGLAIVKRIVERHGGWISVKSEGENAGSCFEFTLPLTAEARASSV